MPSLDRAHRSTLVALMVAVALAMINTTTVEMAAPAIKESLNIGSSVQQWIVSGFTLAFGLAMIPAGRIGDAYGHRAVCLVGLGGFGISSALAATAINSIILVTALSLAGFFAGVFFPAVTALINKNFRPPERRRPFSVLSLVIGIATVIGPLVGGAIITLGGVDVGWRLVFGANIPLAIVSIVMALAWIPKDELGFSDRSIDLIGMVLVTATLFAFLIAIIEGSPLGWPAWTIISVFAGIVSSIIFWRWELYYARSGHTPAIPPSLFTYRSFACGAAIAALFFAAYTSIFFVLILTFQQGLRMSPILTGVVLTPFALGTITGSAIGDRLIGSAVSRSIIGGASLMVGGLGAVALCLVLSPGNASTVAISLAAPLFVGGASSGLFLPALTHLTMFEVPPRYSGSAAGVFTTAQRVGSALGIAAVGAIFSPVLLESLKSTILRRRHWQ